MLSKEILETRESQTLQPYACLSRQTQGRVYPEPLPEYRTEFQRDRDRVIHSKAFRRLKHKTQVFVATGEGDHYRTRMTHTLEVTQIARDLARALGLNEDLAETIALAHDLGHTPFGHAGEKALNKCMQAHGGFEHNRQSKKIVEKLEKKYPEFDGLNLTYEVRDGLVKHRTPFDHSGISGETGPTLEAQCANIGDEIAYNSHDLDDGISGNILDQNILEELPIWRELTLIHRKKYSNLTFKQLQDLNIRKIIHFQISDILLETTQRLTIKQISSLNDVTTCPETLIGFSRAFSPKIDELRKFLFHYFYQTPLIIQRNQEAEKIIVVLFDYYLQNPEQVIKSSTFTQDSSLEEAVADYIAGMTDQYAYKTYNELK